MPEIKPEQDSDDNELRIEDLYGLLLDINQKLSITHALAKANKLWCEEHEEKIKEIQEELRIER